MTINGKSFKTSYWKCSCYQSNDHESFMSHEFFFQVEILESKRELVVKQESNYSRHRPLGFLGGSQWKCTNTIAQYIEYKMYTKKSLTVVLSVAPFCVSHLWRLWNGVELSVNPAVCKFCDCPTLSFEICQLKEIFIFTLYMKQWEATTKLHHQVHHAAAWILYG